MTPPVVQQVKDELMLIEAAERRKHKHFSKEKIGETLNKIPGIKDSIVAKVHEIADSRNITLKPGDCSSDKFIEIVVSQMRPAMESLKQKLGNIIPDEAYFDDKGRCKHDQDCDRAIQDSLEYITHLINKHEGNK